MPNEITQLWEALVDSVADRIMSRMNGAAPTPITPTHRKPEGGSYGKTDANGQPWTMQTLAQLDRDELKKVADTFGVPYGERPRTKNLSESIVKAAAGIGGRDVGQSTQTSPQRRRRRHSPVSAPAEEVHEEVPEDVTEEVEDSEEEPEAEEDVTEEDEDSEDEEEEEDEDPETASSPDEEEEFWTLAELEEKSTAELRALCKDYDVADYADMSRKELIEAMVATP